jgi:hypothetical protein
MSYHSYRIIIYWNRDKAITDYICIIVAILNHRIV